MLLDLFATFSALNLSLTVTKGAQAKSVASRTNKFEALSSMLFGP
jgi:hypothetical protein